jgi:hypothetical protein
MRHQIITLVVDRGSWYIGKPSEDKYAAGEDLRIVDFGFSAYINPDKCTVDQAKRALIDYRLDNINRIISRLSKEQDILNRLSSELVG